MVVPEYKSLLCLQLILPICFSIFPLGVVQLPSYLKIFRKKLYSSTLAYLQTTENAVIANSCPPTM